MIVASALVAHTAWHWMADRWDVLRQYRVAWPTLDRAFVASAMRGAALLLVVVVTLWGMSVVAERLGAAREAEAR
jgi:hypothetical protein